MPRKAIRTHKITFLLMKGSVKSFREALREPRSLTRIPLKPGIMFPGEFWCAPPKERAPAWQTFVAPALSDKMENLFNASVSAVLFVKAKKRIFAVTFGHGRNLIRPDCYEPSFGLKTALNRIDHKRMRSLDLRSYEDLVVSTRKQTSRSSELGTFGLDVARDMLRAVTGESTDVGLAKRVTGADSLTINVPIKVEDLGAKCQEIIRAFQDDTYKEHFAWIDHVGEVRDKKTIDQLNAKLMEALESGATDRLHLAPPEAVDWQAVDCFRFRGTRQKEYSDLDMDEYLKALGDDRHELTIEKLKSYPVMIRWAGNDQFVNQWTIFNCIVCELTKTGQLYALVDGRWFQIEKTFSERVHNFVKSLPSPAKALPAARIGEGEEKYNERVAAGDPGLVCLDRDLVRPTDAASPIEFCDLLSKGKQFIHVKKKTRSATLSHLFAQGTVSARVFLQDGQARTQVRDHLKRKKANVGFLSLIPGPATRPSPGDYEVLYAIITKPSPNWPLSLPFFSQLNLMQNAKLLQGLGYKVILQEIKEI